MVGRLGGGGGEGGVDIWDPGGMGEGGGWRRRLRSLEAAF